MLEILKEFLNYLKNPKDELHEDQSTKNKRNTFFALLLFSIVFNFFYLFILLALEKLNIISSDSHALGPFMAKNHILIVFAAVVLIGPLLEEFVFRYFLKLKPNKINSLVYKGIRFLNDDLAEFLKRNIKQFWSKYFKWIFYSSAVLFGFVHLYNYTDLNSPLLLWPILILSQVFGGLAFAYLRIRFNFKLAFYAHAIFNFSLIAFFFLSTPQTSEIVKISNENFDLHIEEINYSLTSSYRVDYGEDEYKMARNSLSTIVRQLKESDVQYFETNNQAKTEAIFNLSYKAHNPEALEFKSDTILKYFGEAYGFNVKDINVVKDVYVLRIKDARSLYKHRTTDSIIIFTSNINQIELKAGELTTLANSISSRSKTEIIVKDTISDRFNFTLPTNMALMKQSLNNYGLEIIEDKADLESFFIEFKK